MALHILNIFDRMLLCKYFKMAIPIKFSHHYKWKWHDWVEVAYFQTHSQHSKSGHMNDVHIK